MTEQFEVRFWGTRGSCPTPGADYAVFGGNTSCVSVRWSSGFAVFDGGSGIVGLGRYLARERDVGRFDERTPIHLWISHLHLDHVVGLPAFLPLFWKHADIHLYGPCGAEQSFRERVMHVIGPPYWPITLDQVAAKLTWHEVHAGDEVILWETDGYEAAGGHEAYDAQGAAAAGGGTGIRVGCMRSDHPNDCLLYRLQAGDVSVVYGLDCEATEPVWESYITFAKQCSLLIFDAAYTKEEYPGVRGFGHSYWQRGLDFARRCEARRAVFTHHDWKRTDTELLAMAEQLAAEVGGRCGDMKEEPGSCPQIQAEFAREGMTIRLRQGGL